jgi:hypothetical protein
LSNLTYRDLPVLRAAGFEPSWSGFSWFGTDITGQQWQAEEDQDTGILMFHNSKETLMLTRDKFSELFGE